MIARAHSAGRPGADHINLRPLFLNADDGTCELIEVGAGREVDTRAVVTFTIHTIPD